MSNNEIQVLKAIAHASPTAIRIFTAWALRERHRNEPIKLRRFKNDLIRNGEEIVEADYLNTFSELAKHGFGKLVKSKRGRLYSFTPHWYVKHLGAAGIEDSVTLSEFEKKRVKKELKTPSPVEVSRSSAPKTPKMSVSKTVVFFFVRGKKLRFEIEGDISSEQLEDLTSVLQGERMNEKRSAV